MVSLSAADVEAVALVAAIRSGDEESLTRLLAERPELSTARIVDERGNDRTLLHVVTD